MLSVYRSLHHWENQLKILLLLQMAAAMMAPSRDFPKGFSEQGGTIMAAAICSDQTVIGFAGCHDGRCPRRLF